MAAMVERLSEYLEVPLRYVLLPGGSTSCLLDQPPSCSQGRCGALCTLFVHRSHALQTLTGVFKQVRC